MRRAQWLGLACVVTLVVAVPVIAWTVRPGQVSAALVALGVSAPAARSGTPGPVRLAAPVPEPEPTPPPRTDLARAAVAAAEAAAGPKTELGVAVLDRTTGEVAVGRNGDEPYLTASLAKIVVAVDMVDRRRLQGLTISDENVALLRRALSLSDDNAMNALWTRFDGQGAAARVSKRVDLAATTAPDDPSQWGEMSVPATDFLKLWQYILDQEPAADRDLLVSAMDSAPATARDGFNQAFGLLSPAVRGPGGPGAVAKQGWMCCFSAKYYLHSSGVVGADQRFLVTLLTRQPKGPGWEAARQQLDGVAEAAVQALR